MLFCTLCRLPIDGPSGDPIYAEAAVTGKKKEAVLECAKEACRLLDAAGLLRQSSHGTVKFTGQDIYCGITIFNTMLFHITLYFLLILVLVD